jgi:uncharacterized integral membrane protein
MKYLIITIVVLVLVFVFQNMQVVDIRFLFWKVSMSNTLILFFAVAFGFICGLLFRLSLRSRKGL